MMPDSARKVWREGFQPLLSTKALEALANGLRADDERLIQGKTCDPPPLVCIEDWPVESCCPVAYAGWRGDGLARVGDVEEWFHRLCGLADERLGEPAAVRYFLNWWDESPRAEAVAALLAEVEIELKRRAAAEAV